jgi:transposase-like protein
MEELPKALRKIDESFKRLVVEEYLSTGCSKGYLSRKYKIRGKSAIHEWLTIFGYEDLPRKQMIKFISPLQSSPPPMAKDSQDVQALQKRIKELERQLEDEKLRSEAYSRIIDLAERELKIPIKKKPDTK